MPRKRSWCTQNEERIKGGFVGNGNFNKGHFIIDSKNKRNAPRENKEPLV